MSSIVYKYNIYLLIFIPVYDFAYIVCKSSIYSYWRFLHPIPLESWFAISSLELFLNYYEIIADDENFHFLTDIYM